MTEGEGKCWKRQSAVPAPSSSALCPPRRQDRYERGAVAVFSTVARFTTNGDGRRPRTGLRQRRLYSMNARCEYLKQKDEVGEDVLGPAPWYIAIMTRGEDQIWVNMDHPMSLARRAIPISRRNGTRRRTTAGSAVSISMIRRRLPSIISCGKWLSQSLTITSVESSTCIALKDTSRATLRACSRSAGSR